MKQLLSTVVAGVALLTLVACSSGNTGKPVATTMTDASSSATTGGVPSGVPQVSSPKHINGVDPCTLLTASQLADLGATATPTRPQSLLNETECDWQNDSLRLTITPVATLGRGIAQTYASKTNFSYFQPTTVAGYPAVWVGRESLSCRIYVGISNIQEFSVDFFRGGSTRPDYMDPCGFAATVAGMVVGNLPAGN